MSGTPENFLHDLDANRLNGPQRKVVRKALLDIFRSAGELDLFLDDRGLDTLERTVAPGPYEHRVYQLIGRYQGRGKLDDLLREVGAEFVESPHVQELPHRLALVDRKAESQRVLGGESLEKLVRGSGFEDLFPWIDRLITAGRRVCRITYPRGSGTYRGTGFLVGPDLVLTNFHVIEKLDRGEGGRDPASVRLTFDLAESSSVASAVSQHRLAEDWLVAHSPYSDADLAPDAGLPGADQLDFALVRLRAAAGREKGSDGDKRGWYDLARVEAPPGEGSIVVILQHPDGRPLEQSMGVVMKGVTPLRLRYDADTEPGSSGALVLTQGIVPIALHHAGDPDSKIQARYNQGIPLHLVHRAIESGSTATDEEAGPSGDQPPGNGVEG